MTKPADATRARVLADAIQPIEIAVPSEGGATCRLLRKGLPCPRCGWAWTWHEPGGPGKAAWVCRACKEEAHGEA